MDHVIPVERDIIWPITVCGSSESPARGSPGRMVCNAVRGRDTLGNYADYGAGRVWDRENRPDAEALNPFSDHQDIHNLRAGNPNLPPQDTLAWEAGYSQDAKGLR